MKPLKIAVIGSGISGLSAAWLLSQRHAVTLFEADARAGGHSNTVNCGGVAIDTGFIVYNTAAYPNLVALFDYLNVPTAESTMGFAVSLDGGRYEYSGSNLRGLAGGLRNLGDAGHWRMIADIARFFRTAARQAETVPDDVSLGGFIDRHGYSRAFVERHLLPMAGAIWSSSPEQMRDYPARAFLRFFENHGLLKFANRPAWRTVNGGSRVYVQRLLEDGRMLVRTSSPVERIERPADGVVIHLEGGRRETFDHVVIGTHADQALALLRDPSSAERTHLSAFRYSNNRAVLHRDASLMPKRRRLWSSWNYISGSTAPGCTITYWMNALQPLATSTDHFVTLNPQREPAAGTIDQEFSYQHPVFSAGALSAQRELWALQGRHRTWFCGAHFGSGFHEDGLQSGLAVAEHLGGVMRPWTVANPSGRIHGAPRSPPEEAIVLEAAE